MRYIFIIAGILLFNRALAQNSLTFKVKEESGDALAGAGIVIKGTTTGKITDSNGIAYFDNLRKVKPVLRLLLLAIKKKKSHFHFRE
jgi:uncharacterized membrane protein